MPVEIVDSVPLKRVIPALFLIPFPLERPADLTRLAGRPFIGCGPAEWLEFAFSSACLDYLREPWSDTEFTMRIGRQFPGIPLRLAGSDIILSRGLLKSHRGAVKISMRQETLLRLLNRQAGRPVDRTLLASQCGYADPSCSRSFDIAVSRLRCILDALCDQTSRVLLRSIRGRGLVLLPDVSKSEPVDKL